MLAQARIVTRVKPRESARAQLIDRSICSKSIKVISRAARRIFSGAANSSHARTDAALVRLRFFIFSLDARSCARSFADDFGLALARARINQLFGSSPSALESCLRGFASDAGAFSEVL